MELNFNVGNSVDINNDNDDLVNGAKSSLKSANFKFERIKLKPLSEEKKQELLKELSYVIVQDYNDDYNLSEEEKKEKNKYYEVFSKFNRCKKKYKKISEYIKAMRLALDCVDIVAVNNGIYNPEEFSRKVLKGKLKITGLTFPKYIGKDKKYINYDYLWKIIINKNIDPSEYEGLSDDEDNTISENIINNITPKVINYVDSYEVDDKNTVEELSEEETKYLFKNNPELLSSITRSIKLNKQRENRRLKVNSYVYEMTSSDFQYINELDAKRKFKSKHDIPEFKGDILDDKAYNKYLKRLSDYEEENIKYNYEGKMKSQSEIDEIILKNTLEENGWNLRSMWGNDVKHSKLVEAYKKEKRKEMMLKKKLVKAQEKRKAMKKKKKNKG